MRMYVSCLYYTATMGYCIVRKSYDIKTAFLQCIKLNKQQTKQKGNIMLDFLLKTNLLAPAIFMVCGLLISLFLLLQLNRGKPDEK